jgi:hypothetical protein
MKKHIKKLLWVMGIILGLPIVFNFRLYFSDEIEGWVIDANTNEPLENVEVHIDWDIHTGFIAEGSFGFVKRLKTATDKNGRFYFPAWGPVFFKRGRVTTYPSLIFTKEKYKDDVYSQLSSHDPFILNPCAKFNSNWWGPKGRIYYIKEKKEPNCCRNKALLEKLETN